MLLPLTWMLRGASWQRVENWITSEFGESKETALLLAQSIKLSTSRYATDKDSEIVFLILRTSIPLACLKSALMLPLFIGSTRYSRKSKGDIGKPWEIPQVKFWGDIIPPKYRTSTFLHWRKAEVQRRIQVRYLCLCIHQINRLWSTASNAPWKPREIKVEA